LPSKEEMDAVRGEMLRMKEEIIMKRLEAE